MKYEPEIEMLRDILVLYQDTWSAEGFTMSAPSLAGNIKESVGLEISGERLKRFLGGTRGLREDELTIIRTFLTSPTSKGFYCGPELFDRSGISAPAVIKNLLDVKSNPVLSAYLAGKTFSNALPTSPRIAEHFYSFAFSRTDVPGILKVDLCYRRYDQQRSLTLEQQLGPTHIGWCTVSNNNIGSIFLKHVSEDSKGLIYSIIGFDNVLYQRGDIAGPIIVLDQEYAVDMYELEPLSDEEIGKRLSDEVTHNLMILRQTSRSTRAVKGDSCEVE